jgi:ribonuclease BN (tRNA processing enzyme)
MEIKFIGTGGAFEPEYYNSAAILKFGDKTILIDAGFMVYARLLQLDLMFVPDFILLTHLHNDHCGSLANILLHRYFYGNGAKSTVLYQTEAFKKQIQDFLIIQLKDPEKYADFKPCSTISGLSVLDTYNQHSENFQTYSFIFEEEEQRLVYSGDLGQADFLFNYLLTLPQIPTLIFHDITFDSQNTGHAHYSMLAPFHRQFRIFGYHCDPAKNPDDNPIPLVYNQPEYIY